MIALHSERGGDTNAGSTEVATFDLDVVRRFADLAVDALAGAREEIDALNVYPVPDGDTGTNMYLTDDSARDAIQETATRTMTWPTAAALEAFPAARCSAPAATPG